MHEIAESTDATRGQFLCPHRGRHILQPVLLRTPGQAVAPKLYHVALRGRSAFQGEGLWLAPDSAIGFNTYANSFYAAYWARHSDLDRIEVCGLIRGRGFVRLFRALGAHGLEDLGRHLVGSEGAAAAGPFHVEVALRTLMNPAESEGRLFFDIESDEECEVSALAWATTDPPRRRVSATIGICTFRKEAHVAVNLGNLARYIAGEGRGLVERVYVVNNDGKPFTHPAILRALSACPALTEVDQRNLGGAGGFTRSLAESLGGAGSTHHVMIDDDVFLDPAAIGKVLAFLAWARDEIVAGGQMMNMKAPHVLYEGGAKLSTTGLLERVGVNLDYGRAGPPFFFDEYREVDYNAWWFCAIPKHAAAAAGLPLNIFIRGDDFEYAIRLREHGVRTVSLPGVFVWHEPFEGKTAAWLEYYNIRNRMIFCGAHAPLSGFEQPGRDFYEGFVTAALAAGDREKLAAVLLGIADFLAGPERHFALDAEENHNAMRALLAEARRDHGAIEAGPGLAAIETALGARLQGFDLHLAAELERIAGEEEHPFEDRPKTGARRHWQALAEAVLSAFEADIAAAHAAWGAGTPAHTSAASWARSFAPAAGGPGAG